MSSFNRPLFFLFFILHSLSCLAQTQEGPNRVAKAQVVKGIVKGKVKDTDQIFDIKSGDWISEKTLIQTGPASFVQIRYNTGAQMNVGPNSKMFIHVADLKKPSMISVLKGQIKTTVTKDPLSDGSAKLYIKTRSTAMGIRGTTTITTVSAPIKNQVSSRDEISRSLAQEDTDDMANTGASGGVESHLVAEGVADIFPSAPNEQYSDLVEKSRSEAVQISPGEVGFSKAGESVQKVNVGMQTAHQMSRVAENPLQEQRKSAEPVRSIRAPGLSNEAVTSKDHSPAKLVEQTAKSDLVPKGEMEKLKSESKEFAKIITSVQQEKGELPAKADAPGTGPTDKKTDAPIAKADAANTAQTTSAKQEVKQEAPQKAVMLFDFKSGVTIPPVGVFANVDPVTGAVMVDRSFAKQDDKGQIQMARSDLQLTQTGEILNRQTGEVIIDTKKVLNMDPKQLTMLDTQRPAPLLPPIQIPREINDSLTRITNNLTDTTSIGLANLIIKIQFN